MKKNWQGPSVCILCARKGEFIDHLFLGYSFAIQVWKRVAVRLPQEGYFFVVILEVFLQ